MMGRFWIRKNEIQNCTSSDYAPFGAQLAERSFFSETYPNSFNDKRDDPELGDWQDYGMRMYSTWQRRFVTTDPLMKKFPWNSNYAFAENSSIRFIDLDGGERKDPFLEDCADFGKQKLFSSLTLKMPKLAFTRPKLNVVTEEWIREVASKTSIQEYKQPYPGGSLMQNVQLSNGVINYVELDLYDDPDIVTVYDLDNNQKIFGPATLSGYKKLTVPKGVTNLLIEVEPANKENESIYDITISSEKRVYAEKTVKILGLKLYSKQYERTKDVSNQLIEKFNNNDNTADDIPEGTRIQNKVYKNRKND